MAAIEVNITPEQIDSLIQDSLIKAGLGSTINKAVNEALNGYRSPIADAVKNYVGQVASELIRTMFAEQIKAAVQKMIEERVTKNMIDKLVDEAATKLEKAANEERW